MPAAPHPTTAAAATTVPNPGRDSSTKWAPTPPTTHQAIAPKKNVPTAQTIVRTTTARIHSARVRLRAPVTGATRLPTAYQPRQPPPRAQQPHQPYRAQQPRQEPEGRRSKDVAPHQRPRIRSEVTAVSRSRSSTNVASSTGRPPSMCRANASPPVATLISTETIAMHRARIRFPPVTHMKFSSSRSQYAITSSALTRIPRR